MNIKWSFLFSLLVRFISMIEWKEMWDVQFGIDLDFEGHYKVIDSTILQSTCLNDSDVAKKKKMKLNQLNVTS